FLYLLADLFVLFLGNAAVTENISLLRKHHRILKVRKSLFFLINRGRGNPVHLVAACSLYRIDDGKRSAKAKGTLRCKGARAYILGYFNLFFLGHNLETPGQAGDEADHGDKKRSAGQSFNK